MHWSYVFLALIHRYVALFVRSNLYQNSLSVVVVLHAEYRAIMDDDTNGLAQECSNSSANALELLPSCTKQSIYCDCDCVVAYSMVIMVIDHEITR